MYTFCALPSAKLSFNAFLGATPTMAHLVVFFLPTTPHETDAPTHPGKRARAECFRQREPQNSLHTTRMMTHLVASPHNTRRSKHHADDPNIVPKAQKCVHPLRALLFIVHPDAKTRPQPGHTTRCARERLPMSAHPSLWAQNVQAHACHPQDFTDPTLLRSVSVRAATISDPQRACRTAFGHRCRPDLCQATVGEQALLMTLFS